jgi:tetratricopeptide (TPR) repeat protein
MRLTAFTLSLLLIAVGILALLNVLAPWDAGGQLPAPARFDYVVRDDFFAGLRGDAVRLDRAMKICEELLAKNPRHAEALVWHGAALLIQARHAFERGDPDGARALSTRGVGEMEAAVAIAPADVGVLVPRGAVLSGAARAVRDPERAAAFLRTAVADYEKAASVQSPSFSRLSEHARGELLGGLADGWHRLGDEDRARSYLTRIVAELPGSGYADAAKTWLEHTPMRGGPSLTCIGCHKSVHP